MRARSHILSVVQTHMHTLTTAILYKYSMSIDYTHTHISTNENRTSIMAQFSKWYVSLFENVFFPIPSAQQSLSLAVFLAAQ